CQQAHPACLEATAARLANPRLVPIAAARTSAIVTKVTDRSQRANEVVARTSGRPLHTKDGNQMNRLHTSKRRTLQALLLSASMTATAASAQTITAVMHSGLRMMDPIQSTAFITRDHGYMIYDTLVGIDANFEVQPQMADWEVLDDGKRYRFTLRDGLKWHDGTPVTSEDCVASIKR